MISQIGVELDFVLLKSDITVVTFLMFFRFLFFIFVIGSFFFLVEFVIRVELGLEPTETTDRGIVLIHYFDKRFVVGIFDFGA